MGRLHTDEMGRVAEVIEPEGHRSRFGDNGQFVGEAILPGALAGSQPEEVMGNRDITDIIVGGGVDDLEKEFSHRRSSWI